MVRHWQTPPPSIRHKYGGPGLLDWIMPWVLIVVAGAAFIWTAPLWMPSSASERPDTMPSGASVPQGHPSLDRIWKEHPNAPKATDYGVPCMMLPGQPCGPMVDWP